MLLTVNGPQVVIPAVALPGAVVEIDVPLEVLCIIFGNLRKKDLLSVRRVCKDFSFAVARSVFNTAYLSKSAPSRKRFSRSHNIPC